MFDFRKKQSLSNTKMARNIREYVDDARKKQGIGFLYMKPFRNTDVLNAFGFKKIATGKKYALYANRLGFATLNLEKQNICFSFCAAYKGSKFDEKNYTVSCWVRNPEDIVCVDSSELIINKTIKRLDDFVFLEFLLRTPGLLIPRDTWGPELAWQLPKSCWSVIEDTNNSRASHKNAKIFDFFNNANTVDVLDIEAGNKLVFSILEKVYWRNLSGEDTPRPFPMKEEDNRNLNLLKDFLLHRSQETWESFEGFSMEAFGFHPFTPMLHLKLSPGFNSLSFGNQNFINQSLTDMIQFIPKDNLLEIWQGFECGPALTLSLFNEKLDLVAFDKLIQAISEKFGGSVPLLGFEVSPQSHFYLCKDLNSFENLGESFEFLNKHHRILEKNINNISTDVVGLLENYKVSKGDDFDVSWLLREGLIKKINENKIEGSLKKIASPSLQPKRF